MVGQVCYSNAARKDLIKSSYNSTSANVTVQHPDQQMLSYVKSNVSKKQSGQSQMFNGFVDSVSTEPLRPLPLDVCKCYNHFRSSSLITRKKYGYTRYHKRHY